MLKYIYIISIALIFAIKTQAQQGVSINTTGASAEPTAILDVSSNEKGLLIPRMTNAEKNLISSPAEGLQIINTTSKCIEVYFNSLWQKVFCSCSIPVSPLAGAHIASYNEINWNWQVVTNASGYKYNTTNDSVSATDNGLNTTLLQSNLIPNTSYQLYVWAYNECGYSTPVLLTQQTTQFVCGSTLTFNYRGLTVNYGTVVGQNGTCWTDRNLGASTVATSYNHTNAFGDLFQWGRLDDNHQDRNSLISYTQSTQINPGHSNFIAGFSNWYSGTNPLPNDLWQSPAFLNNPCPIGWRLPTEIEINAERLSWSSNSYVGSMNSPLKIPAAGLRNGADGTTFIYVGSRGYYWTSTTDGTNSRCLHISNNNAVVNTNGRTEGTSIRCVLEQ